MRRKGKNTKQMRTSMLKLLAMGFLILYTAGMQACNTQRHHHKAVPCPCEKKRK